MDNNSSGGVEGEDVYKGKAKPMLVSLSKLYSELELISVDVSRLSFCLSSHCLLTIYTTNYCPKKIVYNFVLRKTFYSR